MSEQPQTPTHYEQVGGVEAIRQVVDRFYERVLADPELTGYFEGADVGRVKRHQVLLLASVLGGPQTYDGRDLAAAHEGLGITSEHFGLVGAHLTASLQEAGAPDDTIAAVLATVGGLEPDIVEAPAPE
jgi:hemoglobin